MTMPVTPWRRVHEATRTAPCPTRACGRSARSWAGGAGAGFELKPSTPEAPIDSSGRAASELHAIGMGGGWSVQAPDTFSLPYCAHAHHNDRTACNRHARLRPTRLDSVEARPCLHRQQPTPRLRLNTWTSPPLVNGTRDADARDAQAVGLTCWMTLSCVGHLGSPDRLRHMGHVIVTALALAALWRSGVAAVGRAKLATRGCERSEGLENKMMCGRRCVVGN